MKGPQPACESPADGTCLHRPRRGNECGVRKKTPCPTIRTFFSTRPYRSYASSVRVAAEPTGATSAPAAPCCRRPLPSRYGYHRAKVPPRLSPCWTPGSPGCAARRSEIPENRLRPGRKAASHEEAREKVGEKQPVPSGPHGGMRSDAG